MSNDVKKQIAKIEDEVSKLLVEQFSSRDTGDEAIKNLKWSESPEHMAKPWKEPLTDVTRCKAKNERV